MTDDETHIAGGAPYDGPAPKQPEHRAGWSPEEDTRSAAPQYGAWSQSPSRNSDAPGGWPGRTPYTSGAPYTRGGVQQAQGSSAAESNKSRSGMGWLAPAIVVVAGIVAIALVLFFTQNKSSAPTSAKSNQTVASNSSSSASSSPSSSSDSTAALPATGSSKCLVSGNSYSTLSSSDAVSTGTTVSCGFGDRVVSDVISHVQSAPGVSSFPLNSEYSDATGDYYNFSCDRQNHLTQCTAQGKHGQIGIAVQDSIH